MDHVVRPERAGSQRQVVCDDDPVWKWHSGLGGHRDLPEWLPASDGSLARAFYESVGGRAKVFLDVLIDNPGMRLSVDDIRAETDGVFSGPSSVAGSITGLHSPHRASGRRYPFYWWAEHPTRYGMKKAVGSLFLQARSDLAGNSPR